MKDTKKFLQVWIAGIQAYGRTAIYKGEKGEKK